MPGSYSHKGNFSKFKNWKRVENFPITRQDFISDDLSRIYLARNTSIKVSISKKNLSEKYLNDFKQFLKQCPSFIEPSSCFQNVNYECYINDPLIKLEIILPLFPSFDEKYYLLALISNNYFDFRQKALIDQLKDFAKDKKKNQMIEYMQLIYKQFSSKQFKLDNLQKQIAILDKLKKHCVCVERSTNLLNNDITWVKKVHVTPSGIFYDFQQPYTSCSLFREQQVQIYVDHFLHIQFRDEFKKNLKKKKNHQLIEFYFKQFVDNLTIANNKFEIFTWRASDLRDFSFWAYYKESLLQQDQIIRDMGHLNQRDFPSVYAAKISIQLIPSIPFQKFQKYQKNNNKQNNEQTSSDKNLTISYYQMYLQKDIITDIANSLQGLIINNENNIECQYNPISCISLMLNGIKGIFYSTSLPIQNQEIQDNQNIRIYNSDIFDFLDIYDINSYQPCILEMHHLVMLKNFNVSQDFIIQVCQENLQLLAQPNFNNSLFIKWIICLLGTTPFNSNYQQGVAVSTCCPAASKIILQNLNYFRKYFNENNDIFLKTLIYHIHKQIVLNIKNFRFCIENGAILQAMVDETGLLRKNEVLIIINDPFQLQTNQNENEQNQQKQFNKNVNINGKVLIIKQNSLSKQDIQTFQAVQVSKLEKRQYKQYRIINYQYPLKQFSNIIIFSNHCDSQIIQATKYSLLDDQQRNKFIVIWDEKLQLREEQEQYKFANNEESNMTNNQPKVKLEKMAEFFMEFQTKDCSNKIYKSFLTQADKLENIEDDIINKQNAEDLALSYKQQIQYHPYSENKKITINLKNLLPKYIPYYIKQKPNQQLKKHVDNKNSLLHKICKMIDSYYQGNKLKQRGDIIQQFNLTNLIDDQILSALNPEEINQNNNDLKQVLKLVINYHYDFQQYMNFTKTIYEEEMFTGLRDQDSSNNYENNYFLNDNREYIINSMHILYQKYSSWLQDIITQQQGNYKKRAQYIVRLIYLCCYNPQKLQDINQAKILQIFNNKYYCLPWHLAADILFEIKQEKMDIINQ